MYVCHVIVDVLIYTAICSSYVEHLRLSSEVSERVIGLLIVASCVTVVCTFINRCGCLDLSLPPPLRSVISISHSCEHRGGPEWT